MGYRRQYIEYSDQFADHFFLKTRARWGALAMEDRLQATWHCICESTITNFDKENILKSVKLLVDNQREVNVFKCLIIA